MAELPVDEWDGEQPEPPAEASTLEPPGATAKLFYPRLDVFVADQLATTYRRSIDGRTRVWCRQWWRHPEAVSRLEALWRAWEHLRLDPATGMSVWLRDHADHPMAALFDPHGPFKGCTPDEDGHAPRQEPLPIAAPPAGLFDE